MKNNFTSWVAFQLREVREWVQAITPLFKRDRKHCEYDIRGK